jgi:hydrogenase 3 maturation protease
MKEMILGIGNTLKCDDGIGIYVALKIDKHLKETENKPGREVIVIDCGTTPENYTSVIRKHHPDRLILVDAAGMGLMPGSYRTVPTEKVDTANFSTHNISLATFVLYVSELCGEVVLIGIQPDNMDFGTVLSGAVRENGDRVVKLIIEDRINEIEPLEA